MLGTDQAAQRDRSARTQAGREGRLPEEQRSQRKGTAGTRGSQSQAGPLLGRGNRPWRGFGENVEEPRASHHHLHVRA